MLCFLQIIMSVVTTFNSSRGTKKYKDENTANQNGAMLDMLAEVATQKLWADNRAETSTPQPPAVTRRKRSKESNGMPLNQAKMLSGNQLVRTFSRFEGDEMKRVFSFQCLLIPKKCNVRYQSFGSETKARNLIKDHLLSHLDSLPEGEVLQVPKQQEEVSYKKLVNNTKTNKKLKAIKPVESKQTVEYSEVPIPIETYEEVVVAQERPCSASDDTICMALAECYEELQTAVTELKTTPDHDYFHHLQPEQNISETVEEYTDVETIWIKSEDKDNYISGITNYVVTVADNNDHPMLSVSNEVEIKTETESIDFSSPSQVNLSQAEVEEAVLTIKTEELPVLQDNRALESETNFEENCVERDEHRQQKKPKGKAKFIGQSAAEKEMAVRMIETMKLKQGSTEPLECQICVPSRVFTAPTTLISHYRSHAGIKPYECHLCGGVFTRQHSLNYHLLIHSNKTRFTCNDCGRKFRHPSHFKEHQRRHTGEAPFECSDCVIRFKTRNTYKRHLKTRHGKVLTQSGGIIILSEEEFRRVRTAPRMLQTRVSSDKENNRRPRPKTVGFVRRKQKRADDKSFEEGEEFIQRYNLSGNWSTNLIEPDEIKHEPEEAQDSDSATALAILQAVGATPGIGSGPTTVMVLSADNIIYNNITA